jgi:hypothetical protein
MAINKEKQNGSTAEKSIPMFFGFFVLFHDRVFLQGSNS